LILTDERYKEILRIRVSGLIIQHDSLLLVKLQPPTRPYPVWMPPGGGVQHGEPLETALKRELFEEAGVEVKTGQLCLIHEFIEFPYHALEFYFRAEITGGNLQKGTDPERADDKQILQDLKFYSFSQLSGIELYPEYLKTHITSIIKHDSNVQHIRSGK